MKAFVSWSGGKDATLSCFKALRDKNLEIISLLNMITENGERSRTHGVSAELMRTQADAIGLPILQRKSTWESYEGEFKSAIEILKKSGIEAGVFGDIDLQPHRDWVERVCKDMDIKAFFPLWKKEREDLLNDFITSGFEAYIITTVSKIMGEEWLGRKIDESFINDLKKHENVDLCGEAGEYHSLVVSGPIFKKRIIISDTQRINKDEYWFLNILKYDVTEKN